MFPESGNTCPSYPAGAVLSSTDVSLDVPIEWHTATLIKYHSCFDREALIESLVSFIKLCVIIV